MFFSFQPMAHAHTHMCYLWKRGRRFFSRKPRTIVGEPIARYWRAPGAPNLPKYCAVNYSWTTVLYQDSHRVGNFILCIPGLEKVWLWTNLQMFIIRIRDWGKKKYEVITDGPMIDYYRKSVNYGNYSDDRLWKLIIDYKNKNIFPK